MKMSDTSNKPVFNRPLRILISAGDVSGDIQGAQLIRALTETSTVRDQSLEILALGGSRMQAAGADLVWDADGVSAVGISEAIPFLIPGLRLFSQMRRALKKHPPDIAVVIDYPGINIPLASFLRKRLGIPVVYYLPPEEWIWSKKGNGWFDRSAKIADITNLVLAAHPIEADFYSDAGCNTKLIGHPLQDVIAESAMTREQARLELGVSDDQLLVALLPASRRQELKLILPLIMEAAAGMIRQRPELQFFIPLASGLLEKRLNAEISVAINKSPELVDAIHIVGDENNFAHASEAVVAGADLALTKSGTVTLELALRDIPQIVVFRLGKLTVWIGRHILKLCEDDFSDVYVALPNLITNQDIVPEFVQFNIDTGIITEKALELLNKDSSVRARQLSGYAELRECLGDSGASNRAAEAIMALALNG